MTYRIPGNFRGAKFSRISRFLLSREIKFREIPPTGRGHVGLIGHSRKFISQKFVSRKFSATKISRYTVVQFDPGADLGSSPSGAGAINYS